jgi:hypothetical protein
MLGNNLKTANEWYFYNYDFLSELGSKPKKDVNITTVWQKRLKHTMAHV